MKQNKQTKKHLKREGNFFHLPLTIFKDIGEKGGDQAWETSHSLGFKIDSL